MAPRVHVFTGPTLASGEVRAALPGALVHPPVQGGDLLRLGAVAGDVVVLVDGEMDAGNAVRHKEILALVEAGVEVWGTGTLGALRAAELRGCGVRAHGRVARLLQRGVLEGDDEVAVSTGSNSTVALVDVRATARAAHRGGLVDADTATRLVNAALQLPPARRSWEGIVGHAVDAGLDADMAWRFEEFARDHAVRLTRIDALSCLEAVRRSRGAAPRATRGRSAPSTTAFAQEWSEQSAGADMPGAGFVADDDVLTLCRLLAVDFPAFQRRVALRTLAVQAAPAAPASAREGQAILREFAESRGLDVDSLKLWLSQRGLRRDELLAHLLRERAVVALLEARDADPGDDNAVEAVLAGIVAEHARRRGFVAPGATRTWERTWLSAPEIEGLDADQRMARLAARTFNTVPGLSWRQPLLQELKLGGVFAVAREAVVEARDFAHEHGGGEAGDAEVVAWFSGR